MTLEKSMHSCSDLSRLYKSKSFDELSSIINTIWNNALNAEGPESNTYLAQLMAILRHLIVEFNDNNAKDFFEKISDQLNLPMRDINTWINVPCFAGQFNSKEDAEKNGCVDYAIDIQGTSKKKA